MRDSIRVLVLDPWNEIEHLKNKGESLTEYVGRSIRALKRYGMAHNVIVIVVAHPVKMSKGSDGNYPCPDVFDITDGAMWNNKMDNIMVYHRPLAQTDPLNPTCEFIAKRLEGKRL